PGASDGARDYHLVSYMGFASLIISLSCQALRELDTTDTRQMWSLIPAVQFQSGKTTSSGLEFGSSIALVFGYYLIQIFSVYYRVYHKDGAIATKWPAYLNDNVTGQNEARDGKLQPSASCQ